MTRRVSYPSNTAPQCWQKRASLRTSRWHWPQAQFISRAAGLVTIAADDGVVLPEVGFVFRRVVVSEVPAARFLAIEAAQDQRFAHRHQVLQVERGVPAGVVLAIALGHRRGRSLFQRL